MIVNTSCCYITDLGMAVQCTVNVRFVVNSCFLILVVSSECSIAMCHSQAAVAQVYIATHPPIIWMGKTHLGKVEIPLNTGRGSR